MSELTTEQVSGLIDMASVDALKRALKELLVEHVPETKTYHHTEYTECVYCGSDWPCNPVDTIFDVLVEDYTEDKVR